MWDLPGTGLEPLSPELAGGFLTTVPPGKPEKLFLKLLFPGSRDTRGQGNGKFITCENLSAFILPVLNGASQQELAFSSLISAQPLGFSVLSDKDRLKPPRSWLTPAMPSTLGHAPPSTYLVSLPVCCSLEFSSPQLPLLSAPTFIFVSSLLHCSLTFLYHPSDPRTSLLCSFSWLPSAFGNQV